MAIGQAAGLGAYTLGTKVGPVAITAHRDGTRTIGTLHSPPTDCFPLDGHLLGGCWSR